MAPEPETQTQTQTQTSSDAFFRYLAMGEDSSEWAVHVINIGYTIYGKNFTYPVAGHPEKYSFTPDNGRVLADHHLIYITRGRGTFWSEQNGEIEIQAGTMILLFPGVRHRYWPDPEIGWDEYWVGISGDHARHVIGSYFEESKPVLPIGIHPELQAVFIEMCEHVRLEVFGFRRIIAAKALECVARLQILASKTGTQTPEQENLIRNACCLINAEVGKPFDFQRYATENGISYTAFRRLFKDHTGLPPRRYLLDMRVRKAQTMLSQTNLTVQAIAEQTGFENSFYFSRYFKQRTGLPPLKYRKQDRC